MLIFFLFFCRLKDAVVNFDVTTSRWGDAIKDITTDLGRCSPYRRFWFKVPIVDDPAGLFASPVTKTKGSGNLAGSNLATHVAKDLGQEGLTLHDALMSSSIFTFPLFAALKDEEQAHEVFKAMRSYIVKEIKKYQELNTKYAEVFVVKAKLGL